MTTHHYSADHDSPENKAFVAAFEKANNGMRPNFMAVAAYDGMALVYQALEKTKGDASGDALIAAMKGMSWMSPRGPVSIDPETRDIVQNIYVRKVEKKDGELYNVEFDNDPEREGPLQGREALVFDDVSSERPFPHPPAFERGRGGNARLEGGKFPTTGKTTGNVSELRSIRANRPRKAEQFEAVSRKFPTRSSRDLNRPSRE